MSAAEGQNPLRLTAENPWPGLQSFDESAQDFFFGRDAEVEELYRLVRRETLTILYGQSGLGKTSLLQAGLFPRLRKANLLPVWIRLDYSAEAANPAAQVKQAIAAALRTSGIDVRPPGEQEALWEYFHRSDVDFWDAQNRIVTLVLVFDQFEERFTLGRQDAAIDSRAENFLNELSQLVENRPPAELQARFDARPDAVSEFDFDKQPTKVILSLREDFLPDLEGLRKRLPSIVESRLRLHAMTRAQAMEVILKSGANLVGESTAREIVEFVAGSHRQQAVGNAVEPVLLSVVLYELNQRRRRLGQPQITSDLLSGSRDEILESFYESALEGLPPQARLFVEEGLLTSTGRRDSLAWEDALGEYNVNEAVLQRLINRHLIRREDRSDGTRVELVHDRLAEVIDASRTRRRAQERLQQDQAATREREVALQIERDAQRRRARGMLVVAGSLGLILLLVLGGGFLYLDSNVWGHTAYFNTFVKQAGMIKGVGRLSEEQVKHRNVSLKFTYKGRKELLRVQAVNSYGLLTIKHGIGNYLKYASDDDKTERECQWEFIRDSKGRVAYEMAFHRQTNLVWGFVYSPAGKDPQVRRAHFVGQSGMPQPQRKTAADYVEFTYDDQGNEIRIRYLDRLGKPQPGPDGAYGEKREFDRRGLAIRRMSLSASGEPMVDNAGNAGLTLEHDALGNMIQLRAFNAAGGPTVVNSGWHLAVERFDEFGNQREMAFYGLDRKPTLSKEGYAMFKLDYDDRGSWTNSAYFDANGAPALIKYGYAIATAKYDERGNQVEWACFDTQGRPAIHKTDGSHRTRSVYDERGHATNTVYLGTDGLHTLTPGGYARVVMKWDGRGNRIEWACFDREDRPAIDKSVGSHMSRAAYDERGNLTNTIYLGMNGLPTLTTSGYAGVVMKWDERGNRIEWACFDREGSPAIDKSVGNHMIRTAYDERGNPTNTVYLGTNGQPTLTTSGYARIVMKWDERGNQIESACFDREDHPAIDTSIGSHMTWTAYDERGNPTNIVYLGTNSLPMLTTSGFAKVALKWDKRKNRIEWACFDPEGSPAIDKSVGNHMSRTAYDQRGNPTNIVYLGTNGLPTLTTSGYASVAIKWDERGNRIEWACFDREGRPALDKSDGSHTTRMAYDERGNQTNSAFLGTDGLPITTTSGYASVAMKWDERRNRIEWACFDREGLPAIDRSVGNHLLRVAYDERGNPTNTVYLGTNGLPTLTKDGYARIVRKWDELGTQVELKYFDDQDRLLRARDEVYITQVVSGEQGERVGLRVGDVVISYDGMNITNVQQFIKLTQSPGESEREIIVSRNGHPVEPPVRLKHGRVGVALESRVVRVPEKR
ncbi:MAG: hypothetical protein DME26_05880 [Verrucomicrobia bacterium]|nr:MAG: hypothetical protein DME26_05880 [Verrucomicrobiota bacterium]